MFMIEDLLRILLAVAAGGLIGLEREFRDKAAGFRTLIFICVGAALFTVLSSRLGGLEDPVRIAANIVTGVGFLGAGVILREGGRVIGLTTAATIWLTAAAGMALGGGQYLLAGGVVLVAMIVLWLFPFFEHRVDNLREDRTYEVILKVDAGQVAAVEALFKQSGLRVYDYHQVKSRDHLTCIWMTSGSPKRHEAVMRQLVEDPGVVEFQF